MSGNLTRSETAEPSFARVFAYLREPLLSDAVRPGDGLIPVENARAFLIAVHFGKGWRRVAMAPKRSPITFRDKITNFFATTLMHSHARMSPR
jgi:hypothetical protein